MFLSRAFEIINEEGFRTFCYALKQKLRDRKSEETVYQTYISKIEPQVKLKSDSVDKISDYIIVCDDNARLVSDYKEILAGYVEAAERSGKSYDYIYADMDKESDGHRYAPDCKPDYSPDTLLSFDYIGGVYAVKKEKYYEGLGLLKNVMENQDNPDKYALSLAILSCCENDKIGHIHHIVAHETDISEWSEQRCSSIRLLKQKLLFSKGIEAQVVEDKKHNNISHIHYGISKEDLVSIVIPSRDNPEILECCLRSIQKYTAIENYEIIVVDNGSNDSNKAVYERMLKGLEVPTQYIYENRDFNFSYMCNAGAEKAHGNLLLFLNDDIEIIGQEYDDTDWISVLAGQAKQSWSGAVGAKLLYPDSSYIQHIGVVNYETSCFAHLYAKAQDDDGIKAYRNYADYNCLCVTGACIMIEKDKFSKAGGFKEELSVTHNDVDICLSLYENGYYNVLRNDVVLYHHESFSRGDDEVDDEKNRRNMKARELTYKSHPQLEKYDPFYSPLLTQEKNDYGFNRGIYSVIYAKPKNVQPRKIHGNNELCETIKITESGFRDDFQLMGFAYNGKKVYYNPVILIYNDNASYQIKARSLCDRVFHLRKGVEENINFAPFYCGIDTVDMQGGEYNIAICIDGKYYNTGKKMQILLRKTRR